MEQKVNWLFVEIEEETKAILTENVFFYLTAYLTK
jgi:hypothetical protein